MTILITESAWHTAYKLLDFWKWLVLQRKNHIINVCVKPFAFMFHVHTKLLTTLIYWEYNFWQWIRWHSLLFGIWYYIWTKWNCRQQFYCFSIPLLCKMNWLFRWAHFHFNENLLPFFVNHCNSIQILNGLHCILRIK